MTYKCNTEFSSVWGEVLGFSFSVHSSLKCTK